MISLILPTYNCFSELAASLPDLIKYLNQLNIKYEVIIVDDFSADSSFLKELCDEYGCIYLRNRKNSGKGYSVRKGFEKARGSILIFMDGDFPFHLDIVGRMAEAFADGRSDIVIGDRTLEASTYPYEKRTGRRIGSKILSFLTNRFIVPGFPDTQCGIKGIRETAYRKISPYLVINGFSFDLELLFIAVKKKYMIQKIPVNTKQQYSSHVSIMYHGLEMILNVVRIYFNYLRKKY